MTDQETPEGVDLEHPNSARVYDYLLGGTANWAIDRALGDEALQRAPMIRTMARINREFLGRAVRFCARKGVSQFLDIGSGVPTVNPVHEVADEIDPDSRCVYIDKEAVAVAHSQVLLEQAGDPDRHAARRGNAEDVERVWDIALKTSVLDPAKPICLLMVSLLHFLPDDRLALDALSRYRTYLPAGSYLVITHGTDVGVPAEEQAQLHALRGLYTQSGTPVTLRPPETIGAFFGDFDLVEPGLVWLPQWRLDEAGGELRETSWLVKDPARSALVGAIGHKA